jgi:DNA-binding transcriptional MerR regulator
MSDRKQSSKVPKDLPGIGAEELREALGISAPAMQDWLNRDLLPYETVKHGKRTYRRFTRENLLQIALILAMVQHGYEPGLASRVVSLAQEQISDLFAGPEVPGARNLVFLLMGRNSKGEYIAKTKLAHQSIDDYTGEFAPTGFHALDVYRVLELLYRSNEKLREALR